MLTSHVMHGSRRFAIQKNCLDQILDIYFFSNFAQRAHDN
jgi:hypothetical protein